MPVWYKTVDYTCQSKYIHYIQTIKTQRMRGKGGKNAAEFQICFLVSKTCGEGNRTEKGSSDEEQDQRKREKMILKRK